MRKAFRFTWILAVAVCCYLGWVYYSRWSARRDVVERIEKDRDSRDKAIVDAHGGGALSVLSFYCTPPKIRAGGTAQLCYSVSNAEKVRIEPPVENVWPSYSRCVNVSPATSTVYKLIAEDADGKQATAMTNIEVE